MVDEPMRKGYVVRKQYVRPYLEELTGDPVVRDGPDRTTDYAALVRQLGGKPLHLQPPTGGRVDRLEGMLVQNRDANE